MYITRRTRILHSSNFHKPLGSTPYAITLRRTCTTIRDRFPTTSPLPCPKHSTLKKQSQCSKTNTYLILSMWKNLTNVILRILTSALSKIPLSRMSRISSLHLERISRTSVIKFILKNLSMICGLICYSIIVSCRVLSLWN